MMMDTEQRVKLVKLRTREKCRNWEKHIMQRLSLLSVAFCCCLIYAVGYFSDKSPCIVQGMSGATMLLNNAGCYVLVGVVCFTASVVVTVACLRRREKNKRGE